MAGELIAQKANKGTGPTAVVIPTQGFSQWDKPGGFTYDPEADRAFAEAVKKQIEPRIEVIELDMHIDDPAFAEEVVAIFDSMMKVKTT